MQHETGRVVRLPRDLLAKGTETIPEPPRVSPTAALLPDSEGGRAWGLRFVRVLTPVPL